MAIPDLAALLDNRRQQQRVFAGFKLGGFQASAQVQIAVCPDSTLNDCVDAGLFFVLGKEFVCITRTTV
jgi:hypothetical protein